MAPDGSGRFDCGNEYMVHQRRIEIVDAGGLQELLDGKSTEA
jgi:hypothetical protein